MSSVLVLDTNVVLNQVIVIKCLMLKLCEGLCVFVVDLRVFSNFD